VLSPEPVNANATPEARVLLEFVYSHKGKAMLSGEHNQMWRMSEPSERIHAITGQYPLIWGGEWGFSDERHDIDNVKYRPRLMQQIRDQHAAGRIVVITFHQACPTVGEPCGFVDGVQKKLFDEEWDEILTEGTSLNREWQQCVDRLAAALNVLQSERIPIIFRPYHEMNGGWFWWGGDPVRFKALWSMIYDRYVNLHGLNNLLWAWNPDKPYPGVEEYFPGLNAVDFLGTDIYPDKTRPVDYPQEWFDRMADLAGPKPLALSEMSVLPDPADFDRQPWSWFMGWDGMIFNANTEERLREVFSHPIVVSRR